MAVVMAKARQDIHAPDYSSNVNVMFVLQLLFGLLGLLPACIASSSDLLDSYVSNDGVIYADDQIIQAVFAQERNFTLCALFTTERESVNCQFCKVFAPDFKLVASLYNKQTTDSEKEMYFLYVDLDSNREAFKTLGMTHVPNLVFYPPATAKGDIKRGLLAEHKFTTFLRDDSQVDVLIDILKPYGVNIEIVTEFPWSKLIEAIGLAIITIVVGLAFREKVLKLWRNKKIWLAISLMSVIMFISGHMYNVTRGTKFMGYNGKDYVLIDPSFQSQFAVETQIVAVLYSSLAFIAIGMIKLVSQLKTRSAQSLATIICSLALLVICSILINLFKVKSYGFPISLLPISLF